MHYHSTKRFVLAITIIFLFAFHAYADDIYKIKKGDTLSKISKKFGIKTSQLMKMNGLKKSSKLRIGQTLTVRKTGLKTYTVKNGDTIAEIAKRFDIDVDEFMEINLLSSNSSLKLGEKLLLEHSDDDTEIENLEEELKQLVESDDLAAMSIKERLVLFADRFLNIPYRFGGSSIMGIDCSAFVQRVYGLVGIEIPRSARLQYREGEPIDKDSLSIGDLVFFRTYASFPSHVGIYLGNNLFIHASSGDRKVRISSMNTPYYIKRFIGAKRLIFDDEDEVEKAIQEELKKLEEIEKTEKRNEDQNEG